MKFDAVGLFERPTLAGCADCAESRNFTPTFLERRTGSRRLDAKLSESRGLQGIRTAVTWASFTIAAGICHFSRPVRFSGEATITPRLTAGDVAIDGIMVLRAPRESLPARPSSATSAKCQTLAPSALSQMPENPEDA